MYLEKPIEELMKLIEESGYSTYASWKIQHEMEEAKRLYDYLIEVQGVPDEETLKRVCPLWWYGIICFYLTV